jgi:Flp pilus assembly protein TadB
MTIYQEIASKYPQLRRKLKIGHISETPEMYTKKSIMSSVMMSAILTFGATLFMMGFEVSLLYLPLVLAGSFLLFYWIFMRRVDVKIHRLANHIDRDVLFAGRFLLIKLNSGRPLMNAIIDASNSYGVANRYFKEIVREIELGTPLEEALEYASRYSPSEKMRRILFQLSNALKIGIDVTNFLEAILDEIAEDQLLEIKNYGHKLSGLTLFYMLFAIVIPSLGITMFIAVVSLVNIPVDFGMFVVFLFALVVIEFIFISIFKSIRPNVNI